MIKICPQRGLFHERIAHEVRFSQSQREALRKIASEDPNAALRGVDQKMRPVVVMQPNGSDRKTTFALLRNGEPRKPVMPLYEDWQGD